MKSPVPAILLMGLILGLPLPGVAGERGGAKSSTALDQSNTKEAGAGWTNLVNHAMQTFIPSLPKLARVEVELVVANPGTKEDSIQMTVRDLQGNEIVVADKTVLVPECGCVVFDFSEGGLEVTPGKVYSIEISGGTLFGWKYSADGYKGGEAFFNGKPLLPDAHASFLFRTFGGD